LFEGSSAVVEGDLGLSLIGSDQEHDAGLAAHEIVLAETSDVGCQDRHGSGLAAAPADNGAELLHALEWLGWSSGQGSECGSLLVGEWFAHGCDEQDAPGLPRLARKDIAKQGEIGQGFSD
jgi:hypothetical protein